MDWLNSLPDLRRILKSCVPTIVLLVALAVLATYAFAAPAPSHSSYVRSPSYFNDSGCKDPLELEWLADPGTNRFVTNNINDFIAGTVVYSALNVAVGGGYYYLTMFRVNLNIQYRP